MEPRLGILTYRNGKYYRLPLDLISIFSGHLLPTLSFQVADIS
jgi:hypothetical protein